MAKIGSSKHQNPNSNGGYRWVPRVGEEVHKQDQKWVPRVDRSRSDLTNSASSAYHESKQSNESPPLTLDGKDYQNALEKLAETTAVRVRDFDQRVLQLLEVHSAKGTVVEAINHLGVALSKLDRDHTANWRAYIYTLLKKFDEKAYHDMKSAESPGRRRPRTNTLEERQEKKGCQGKFPVNPFSFNPEAEAFVPKVTPLNPDAQEFVPV